jgi:hypothetical protein
MRMLTCGVLLLGFAVSDIRGVVLASGDGITNTTDPGTGLPFRYVGIVNSSASGIFLGNSHGKSWVLTANHVGLGLFVLGGNSYSPVLNSGHRLLNPDRSPSDILLFQIGGNPNLMPLKLAQAVPVRGNQIYLIGFGRDRETDRSYWVDQGQQWTQIPSRDLLADRIGFKWSGPEPGPERWGTALVERKAIGISHTVSFYTGFFDRVNCATVSTGDSGGGAFIQENGQWLLAGMLDAASELPNQPAGTSILVNSLGQGSATIIADLSQYQSQINAVLASPPDLAPGLSN